VGRTLNLLIFKMEKKFHKKVLKNGMTILFEKRDLPVVSVAFAVRHGGIHEEISEKGISHFIEHMLYKGTKTRTPKQISEELEKNGGEMNGFTENVITAYWCKMPSDKLKIALDVLSDLVKNPLFEEKELEKERQVIFEEIKMYHDNPLRYVFEEIQKCLYDGTLSIDLIGTKKTMNSIDREKMVEKFKSVYTPNNMILCVVGNADFDELVDFAEKNFGNTLKGTSEKSEISVKEFGLKNEVKVEERKGIDQANLVFAYHVPLVEDKKSDAARILTCLMAGGLSSRLFEEIREKRNLAYAIKGGSQISKYFAYNFIYVGTMKENVEKVKELILKEFEKVAKSLDEKELNSVKEQLIGNYKISQEDSVLQMQSLLFAEMDGQAEEFYEFEKNIKEVKLEDVKNLAKIKDYSFFALVPKD